MQAEALTDTPQSRATAAENPRSTGYGWYVVVLLSTIYTFSYIDRTALSVLLPLIKQDLHLSDGQLGLLVGFAFFLFYAVCGIPIARWADRGNRSSLIAIMLTIWSLMTMVSGAAQNFWQLLLARVGLGAGEAGCIPAGQSIIADYISVKRRSTAYAITAFGMSSGSMLGLVLAGWLGEAIGWRWTFVALGLPGIVFVLLVKLTLHEPVRGANDGLVGNNSVPLREAAAILWRCRTYRWALLVFIISGFASAGMWQWWPSFYGRVFGFGSASIGMSLGLAIGAGSAIGTIVGGVVGHKSAQGNIRLPLLVGAIAMGLALPAAVMALLVPSAWGSMVLTFATSLLCGVASGPLVATIQSVTRPRMRATASAFSVFLVSVCGFGLGPFCVGVLSDSLTPLLGIEALRYALLLPACSLAGASAALYAVSKSLPDDLREAREFKPN